MPLKFLPSTGSAETYLAKIRFLKNVNLKT